jgi:hypothetical protein
MSRAETFLVSICLTLVLVNTVSGANVYRKDTQRGWWWYEDPPPVSKEEKVQEPSLPAYSPEQMKR